MIRMVPLILLAGCVGGPPADSSEKRKETRVLLDLICEALDIYWNETGTYPASGEDGLVRGLLKVRRPVEFLEWDVKRNTVELHDPWGRPLRYYRNGFQDHQGWTPRNRTSFDLYSVGPNGRDEKGAGDDIRNW